MLSVDEVSVKQIDGEVYQFPTEKERLLRVLRHQVNHVWAYNNAYIFCTHMHENRTHTHTHTHLQVVVHRMQEASKLAKERNWHIVHMHSRPLLSPALAKSNESYMEACSLVMETPDAKTYAKHQLFTQILHYYSSYVSQLLMCFCLLQETRSATRVVQSVCEPPAIRQLDEH